MTHGPCLFPLFVSPTCLCESLMALLILAYAPGPRAPESQSPGAPEPRPMLFAAPYRFPRQGDQQTILEQFIFPRPGIFPKTSAHSTGPLDWVWGGGGNTVVHCFHLEWRWVDLSCFLTLHRICEHYFSFVSAFHSPFSQHEG